MAILHYSLERHIFHLLFQENSVDVPGFGRMETQRFGAEIQLQSGLFLPPARRLSFSPMAGKSDLLLNHLTRYEGLSASEARSAIAQSVSEWNRALLEGKRLRLEGLGSFSKTGLQWVFQASIESNFLPEAYGLPIFRVTPLSQRTETSGELGYILPVPRVAKRRDQWLAPFRAAAVVTGAISLMALGTTKSDFRDFVQNASFRPQWEAMTNNVRTWFEPAPAEKAVADTFGIQEMPPQDFLQGTILEEVVPEAILDVASEAANSTSPASKSAEKTEIFALVVGAFLDDRNAHRLTADLQKAGYPAKVLRAKIGLTKVALRTFATRDAAESAKEEAKKAFPAVWIYSE